MNLLRVRLSIMACFSICLYGCNITAGSMILPVVHEHRRLSPVPMSRFPTDQFTGGSTRTCSSRSVCSRLSFWVAVTISCCYARKSLSLRRSLSFRHGTLSSTVSARVTSASSSSLLPKIAPISSWTRCWNTCMIPHPTEWGGGGAHMAQRGITAMQHRTASAASQCHNDSPQRNLPVPPRPASLSCRSTPPWPENIAHIAQIIWA